VSVAAASVPGAPSAEGLTRGSCKVTSCPWLTQRFRRSRWSYWWTQRSGIATATPMRPAPMSFATGWPGGDREHCAAVGFRVHAVQTIAPAGDQGLLWRRPYGQGALRRVIGPPRAARLFERLGAWTHTGGRSRRGM